MLQKRLWYVVLYLFETASAILYAVWLAPHFAAMHLDLETLFPGFILILSILGSIAALVRSGRKNRPCQLLKHVWFSFLLWGLVLYLIGLYTPCPVCSGGLV